MMLSMWMCYMHGWKFKMKYIRKKKFDSVQNIQAKIVIKKMVSFFKKTHWGSIYDMCVDKFNR